MGLRVEYFYDDESHNWGFVVPSLHIVGSGETREDAEQEARDAILFTLEGEDEPVQKGMNCPTSALASTGHRSAAAH